MALEPSHRNFTSLATPCARCRLRGKGGFWSQLPKRGRHDEQEIMVLYRLTETGRSPYLRHSESFPPVCGKCFNSIPCIAVPQALMVQVVDTLIANLKNTTEEAKSSKPEIFQTWRRRHNGRLVWFEAVERCRTESCWRVGCIFRRRAVQDTMRDSTWWYATSSPITLLHPYGVRYVVMSHKHTSRGFCT